MQSRSVMSLDIEPALRRLPRFDLSRRGLRRLLELAFSDVFPKRHAVWDPSTLEDYEGHSVLLRMGQGKADGAHAEPFCNLLRHPVKAQRGTA